MRHRSQITRNRVVRCACGTLFAVVASLSPAFAQRQEAGGPASTAPQTLTLQDALALAQKNDPQLLTAQGEVRIAREDRVQARAALLPSVGVRSEYLGTQGNGLLASGRYVTNDGVHVYRDWGVVHQDLSPGTLLRTGSRRAAAAEALAQAKAEIARRGLAATVVKAYYALVTAQRKYATAQLALEPAKHSLDISQSLERGGEVAHSDVVKFQLQYATTEQAFRESRLLMETARLDLAVLLFRDFNENFSVVDDLHLAAALPSFAEVEVLAERENPNLRAANAALRAAKLDVSIARQAFLPTLTVDFDYGIEANAFALHSAVAAFREAGPLPNLGYFVTASLNLPVWDWGTRRSKVRQAEVKHEQATVELSATQRELLRNLHAFYQEAQTAREQVESLQRSADLAAESLRLNSLRYEAGEATVLELVDAQTTLTQARNAYDDGMVRYRLAVANVQTLTGAF
jgi:outer membrane protein TolC